jgi:hypothetical protein
MLRRSFLAGVGAVTVGLLFRRKLDRVLVELENEAAEEAAIAASDAPAGAVITALTQQAFQPQQLIIQGTKIGTRMVPVTRFEPCPWCEEYETYCVACNDTGGRQIETGELKEQDVTAIPWMIDELTIDGRPQLDGSIPGDMFAATAIDSLALFDAASPDCEIQFRVRYIGDNPQGEMFYAAMIGTGLSVDGQPCRKALPINSCGKWIVA